MVALMNIYMSGSVASYNKGYSTYRYFIYQDSMMTVSLDIGMGNKKRLSDISRQAEGYNKEYCEALLGLHAFTECGTTSSFMALGKWETAGKSQMTQ